MAGRPPPWVTKAQKSAGVRPAARCWHCYVWNEGEGQYLIQCIHCGNVTHRIETLDDADFIARKCRETRVAHNQLCRRAAR